jgi:hypothetical protein
MNAILVAGLLGCLLGFGLLTVLSASTPRFMLMFYQTVLGGAFGLVMPNCFAAAQNAAERRDIGAATGCLLFLRSMGGAFGSTMVGALRASGWLRPTNRKKRSWEANQLR